MTPPARTPSDCADDDVRVSLPDDVSAPGVAREVVRETLTRWCLPELFDDVELAVSELVTNAFKHALPPVVLQLSQRAAKIRIDVSDMRPATVTVELPIASQLDDESGRGRGIVAAVSDDSGTDHAADGGPGASAYASWDIDPETSAPAG